MTILDQAVHAPRVDPSALYVVGDAAEGYLVDKRQVKVWAIAPSLVDTVRLTLAAARSAQEENHPLDPRIAEVLEAWCGQPSHFPSGFAALESELEPEVEGDPHDRRVLPNLAINVANDCNLSCTYCYANKGFYEGPKGLLGADDARAIARRFIDEFDDVAGVQFMGGEPSMSEPAMRAVAEEFERALAAGQVTSRPTYRIVTNAVVFTPRFLDLCERHDVQLTVSLDGPQGVHDSARPRVGGSGSYDAVRRNVDVALARGLQVGFEPTFSMAHLRAGCSLVDLLCWFHDEFGVPVLHAPPMSRNRYLEDDGLGLSVEDKVEQFCSASAWSIDRLLGTGDLLMHDYTLRILVGLSKREVNEFICPAGNSQIAVSTAGELSPCWMFTDEASVDMGSVWDREPIIEQAQPVLDTLAALELRDHPVCQACVMQPVCFGCKGGDFHEGSALDAKPNCDYMRAMLATVISTVLRRDRESATASLGERVWPELRPVVASSLGDGPGRPPTGPRPVMLPMPRVRA